MATITERWDALDEELRDALHAWYNMGPGEEEGDDGLGDADREALLGLVESGRFWFWECPVCDEQCTHGDPDNWSMFQGVDNQEYQSYPGDPDIFTTEALAALCDECRRVSFGMPEEGRYPPVDACIDH